MKDLKKIIAAVMVFVMAFAGIFVMVDCDDADAAADVTAEAGVEEAVVTQAEE